MTTQNRCDFKGVACSVSYKRVQKWEIYDELEVVNSTRHGYYTWYYYSDYAPTFKDSEAHTRTLPPLAATKALGFGASAKALPFPSACGGRRRNRIGAGASASFAAVLLQVACAASVAPSTSGKAI